MSEHSYHDVTVYVGSTQYKPSDNYALRLTCTRVAGWELWKVWEDEEKLLGGEFADDPFCIVVGDFAIVGVKPNDAAPPPPFGWDGKVSNPPK